MHSVEYYNKNAEAFVARTVKCDISYAYAKFLPHLVQGATLLDAGCGSGRDSLYFKEQGFQVTAFDASIEMVKASSKLSGIPALHMCFQELEFKEKFDGIWASASLLHVPYQELESVFQKLHAALKPSGILYATFKYGDACRNMDGRTFYDMNETSILPFISPLFAPLEIWITADLRSLAQSPDKAWLNILVKKEEV